MAATDIRILTDLFYGRRYLYASQMAVAETSLSHIDDRVGKSDVLDFRFTETIDGYLADRGWYDHRLGFTFVKTIFV